MTGHGTGELTYCLGLRTLWLKLDIAATNDLTRQFWQARSHQLLASIWTTAPALRRE